MSNQRKAMCIWCGHEVWYAEGDTAGQEKAWADLIAHDGTCPKNPTAAERDRYREALEWITRNLTDACTDLKCEGCKLTIQEVIHRATNALKGA